MTWELALGGVAIALVALGIIVGLAKRGERDKVRADALEVAAEKGEAADEVRNQPLSRGRRVLERLRAYSSR